MRSLIQFSDSHLQRLRVLGVQPMQIEKLERCLHLCHSVSSNLAPANKVGADLGDLSKALRKANKHLMRMSRKDPLLKSSVPQEAYRRFQLELDQRGIELDAAQVVSQLAIAAEAAVRAMPKKQRRPLSASPLPVQYIHEALQGGWTPELDTDRYPYEVSTGINSAFRRIVGICYEAFTGKRDADPERAIKAFQGRRRPRTAQT